MVKDNRIISQGYNGFLPGVKHESIMRDGHEQATIHAEQNAIVDFAKSGVSCNNCIAYVTHYPCIIYMRLLCASGIKEIKYIEDYYNNDPLCETFSTMANVTIIKI